MQTNGKGKQQYGEETHWEGDLRRDNSCAFTVTLTADYTKGSLRDQKTQEETHEVEAREARKRYRAQKDEEEKQADSEESEVEVKGVQYEDKLKKTLKQQRVHLLDFGVY
eukprot:TRINITY_DN2812_c0_g1_i1.p3 TRINITY_DN2812_c0_g1~~TRINITY_DN2812_c0_g1_i1.p3  ORF type:complete len:110 (+),score=8.31 TRINITY_DN2812_c0_g1_i1:352-681(+)